MCRIVPEGIRHGVLGLSRRTNAWPQRSTRCGTRSRAAGQCAWRVALSVDGADQTAQSVRQSCHGTRRSRTAGDARQSGTCHPADVPRTAPRHGEHASPWRGAPLSAPLVSASVFVPTCATAKARATALTVADVDSVARTVERAGLTPRLRPALRRVRFSLARPVASFLIGT